jgi:hypothetical protein
MKNVFTIPAGLIILALIIGLVNPIYQENKELKKQLKAIQYLSTVRNDDYEKILNEIFTLTLTDKQEEKIRELKHSSN